MSDRQCRLLCDLLGQPTHVEIDRTVVCDRRLLEKAKRKAETTSYRQAFRVAQTALLAKGVHVPDLPFPVKPDAITTVRGGLFPNGAGIVRVTEHEYMDFASRARRKHWKDGAHVGRVDLRGQYRKVVFDQVSGYFRVRVSDVASDFYVLMDDDLARAGEEVSRFVLCQDAHSLEQ